MKKFPYTRAVYDTLPPAATRFNIWGNYPTAVYSALASIGTNVEVAEITVPAGYVYYLKKINFDNIYLTGLTVVPATDTVFSVSTQRQQSTFTQNMLIQPVSGDNEVFLIAGPGDTITVTATYDYSGVLGITTVTFFPHFMGDVIPVNELPPQLSVFRGQAFSAI